MAAISRPAADPCTRHRLYAGGPRGILVSDDGRAIWSLRAPHPGLVYRLAPVSGRRGTIWAAAMEQGLWVSRDGGTTGQESDSGVNNPGGMGIAAWADGRRLIAGTVRGGLTAGTDLGATRATAGCPAGVIYAIAQAVWPAGPVIGVGQSRGVVRLSLGSGGG